MPQKLTVNDYTFYLVKDIHGGYRFGDIQGTVHRKTHEDFASMMRGLSVSMQTLVLKLFGIASVQNVETEEHTLVYDIFEDLRKEQK